ncbi:hypothetical protein [Archangium sp.]|uniref:hypothetical protein n=1 Tax=Archangium sp. TaxID=1872627 RepID=UPI002D4530BF|nr:hypothetical protein [Archangium sp.]HYO59551.1 hypothetical protein [Archangium sp.]
MRITQAGLSKWTIPLALLGLPGLAHAGSWFVCGNLGQLSSCQLPGYPTTQYEYAIQYSAMEPLPVACVTWNVGWRIHNKEPHFVHSDNPASGMKWGGSVFYSGTHATDDDDCQSGTWRHRYWHLDANNAIVTGWSNGCVNQPLYCRVR